MNKIFTNKLLLGYVLGVAFLGSIELKAQSHFQSALSEGTGREQKNAEQEKVANLMGKSFTGFTENKGQIHDLDEKPNTAVKYLLNMPGLNVQLRQNGFSYDAWTEDGEGKTRVKRFHRVDIDFAGANPEAQLVAEASLKETQNIIVPNGSFENIHSYHKVTYKSIYPGIDLEFEARAGKDKPVEYNFIIHPGADASLIQMQYKGPNSMALKNGSLEMKLGFGTLQERIPASYLQQTKEALTVNYQPTETEGMYAFNVPAYDRSKTLVIDPTPNLVWATYYTNYDNLAGFLYGGSSVTTDYAGNIYLIGSTSDLTIGTAGTQQQNKAGSAPGRSPFIAKFSAAGNRIWATYYSILGDDYDFLYDINYDPVNSALYVTGSYGTPGMGTAGVAQQTIGGLNGFLARFNPATGNRTWATYYGGSYSTFYNVETDASGNVYALGDVYDGSFATVGQTTLNGSSDAMLVKFDPANGTRIWATYFGGAGGDAGNEGMTLDASGNIYIGMYAPSTGIASNVSEGQSGFGTFMAKFSSAGAVQWGRYYSGSTITSMRYDNVNNVLYAAGYAGGTTAGVNGGLGTTGTFKNTAGGGNDGFLSQFAASGVRNWSTYIGGTGADRINVVTTDNSGNVFVAGNAQSNGLATSCATVPTYTSGTKGLLMKFNSTGGRTWGTYYSANFVGLSVDGNGDVVALGAGGTDPATSGAFQTTSYASTLMLVKFNEGLLPAGFKVSASTLSPTAQTTCILSAPALVTGNPVVQTAPATYSVPLYYQWQKATATTGPWTDITGEVFQNFTPPPAASGIAYYRRVIKAYNGCNLVIVDSSATTSVTINSNPSPIANADGPLWYLCSGNTINFAGSSTGGTGAKTYAWYVGSATTAAVTTASYTPTVSATTTYTLKVTDINGCADIDQVNVIPVVADAGPDITLCQSGNGIQIGTPPIGGTSVAYSWAITSGTAGSLSCTNCAQPFATPTANSIYTLTITVTRKDGSTCTSTDAVTINYVAAPNAIAAFAGADKTICKGSTTTLGTTADATYAYTWSPSSFLSSGSVAQPVFSAGAANIVCPTSYILTAIKSGCSFYDQVNVSVISMATTLDGKSVCSPAQSDPLPAETNCSGVTYKWKVRSGTGAVQGIDTNPSGVLTSTSGNTVFYRETTINGVTCTSGDITVGVLCGCPLFTIVPVSPQGCPKAFAGTPLVLSLSGVDFTNYNVVWSPASLVNDPTAQVVTVSSLAPATITATITNKFNPAITCFETISINGSGSLPSFPQANKATCTGTPVQIGNPTIGGYTYQWSPVTGLSDPNAGNPVSSVSQTTIYGVVVTEIASGCKLTVADTVKISDITYTVGPDHVVCNNGVVTLGTTPPVGAKYIYHWTPVNAAFQNSTDSSTAQPQVLFGGASNQTFTVLVTDTATGCTYAGSQTIRNSQVAGEYAGTTPASPCPGTGVQIGSAAMPTAIYSWSPSASLSSPNISNPIASPTANTLYTVLVSYPGCLAPISQTVQVNVQTVAAFDFTDKTICPGTPTNIGVGGTGNPASIANAQSFSWTPTTGLSCTTCASPLANPKQTTTYTVTVKFINGCTATDQVTVTPTFVAVARPDGTVCAGSATILGVTNLAGPTYTWSVLSGTQTTALSCTNCASPVATPGITSVYKMIAVQGGCTVTDTVQVTVATPPAFLITGNSTVCAGGGSATLAATPASGNMNYQWTPVTGVASPNSASTVIVPTATTVYRLVQTDAISGCSNYQDVTVVLRASSLTATGGNVSICAGNTVALPLTVVPAGTYLYSWTPTTNLSNPAMQNPVTYTNASSSYIATVTDNTTKCQDTALVTVTVLSNCTSYDYGDAPVSYEQGSPARHTIVANLYMGNGVDGEGGPASSATANGDDANQTINDEDGVANMPLLNLTTGSYAVAMSKIFNNTGSTAYLVGWIDLNKDGDFADAGEQSVVIAIPSSASAQSAVLTWSGFNPAGDLTDGTSFIRFRLTTDISGSWNTAPSPVGNRSSGEEEDYQIFLTKPMPPVSSNITTTMSNSNGPTQVPTLTGSSNAGNTIKSFTVASVPNTATQGTLTYCTTPPSTGCGTPVTAGKPLTPAQAGTLSFDPLPSFTGSIPFTYFATADNGLVSQPTTYTIVTTNNAPLANAISMTTISNAGPAAVPPLSGGDADGSVVSYSIPTLPLPAEGVLTYCSTPPSTGCGTSVIAGSNLTPAQAATITFTPAPGYTGTIIIPYTDKDNSGYVSSPAKINITVAASASTVAPPVATDIVAPPVNNTAAATLLPPLHGSTLLGTITGYTVTTIPNSATQGLLTYCVTPPSGGCGTIVTPGLQLSIAQSQSLYFDPLPTYTGPVTFNYTTTNSSSLTSAPATVLIPVVNQPPTAENITFGIIPVNSSVTKIPSLSGNDVDGTVTGYTVTTLPAAQQGTLTYCTSPPSTGCGTAVTANQNLSIAQAATLSFTPATGFSGTSTYTYTSTDNNGNVSKPAVYGIVVGSATNQLGTNLPPVTSNITASTPSGITVAIPSLIGSDVDGSVATYVISAIPPATEGILQLCSNSTIPCTGTVTSVATDTKLSPSQISQLQFVPAAGFAGPVTAQYYAIDNQGAPSNVSDIKINVTNKPPVATNSTAPPVRNTAATPTTLPALTATDADGSVASYKIISIPDLSLGLLSLCTAAGNPPTNCTPVASGQVLSPAEASQLAFTPASSFTGFIPVNFTAIDNNGNIGNPATMIIPTASPVALPVKLISFTGKVEECAALISWKTGAELNANYYSVEYSIDGSSFIKVGEVKSANKLTGSEYNYVYSPLSNGMHYFRIKAVDFGADYSYSKVIALNAYCGNAGTVRVSPNPTPQIITVSGMNGNSSIILIDAAGRQLIKVASTTASHDLDLAPFAQGLYLVRVTDSEGRVTNVRVVKK